MFKRSGTLFAFAAALLLTVTAVEANAGQGIRRHHHVAKRITVKTSVRIVDRSRIAINLNRLHYRHRLHREVNTYSGNVAVYERPGVGTWSYGSMSAPVEFEDVESSAKIIDLSDGKNDCSMEHGVCVIRP